MADKSSIERRRHTRYDSEVKVVFYTSFNFEAKLDFRFKKPDEKDFSHAKYYGTTKNISAEGLCFMTNMELCKRDSLWMELFLPSQDKPVLIQGRVRWSRVQKPASSGEKQVETGITVLSVNGEEVQKTLVLDEVHKIYWSNLLECVLGEYKHRLSELPTTQD